MVDASTNVLLLRPGVLIDCTGSPGQRGTEVLVKGDRIDRIGPVGSTTLGHPSPRIITAPNMTLIPGMIDLHAHPFHWKQRRDWQNETLLEAAVKGAQNASRLLDMGVTTIRDVGARDNLSIQLRELIKTGDVRGPRMFASGTPIWVRGRANYHLIGIEINGPDEARAAARRQLRAGADWVKLMATAGVGGGTGMLVSEPGWQELAEEEMHVVAVEAHNAGRKVAAHAIGAKGIKSALRAGVDSIEHGNFVDDEGISLMVDRNVPLVPTLEVNFNFAEHGLERGWDRNVVEGSKRALAVSRKNVLKAHQAGVRIGTGSDMEVTESVAGEVRMLVEAGLTRMQALLAATQVAGDIVGLGNEIGTIAKGKLADLVLLDGNPLEDERALERVEYVVHWGNVVKEPAA